MKPNKAVAQARLAACRKQPAMTSAILSLVPVEKPGLGTFAVDQHWRMYFDPTYAATVTPDEAAGIIIHETMHLVLRHGSRAQQIAPPEHRGCGGIWNIAADLAINSVIRAQGIALPKDGVFPETFNLPENKSAESYYFSLLEQADAKKQQANGQGKTQPSDGTSGSDAQASDGSEMGEPGAEQPGESDAACPGGMERPDDSGSGAQGQPSPGERGDAADGGQGSCYGPQSPGVSGSCSDGQPRPWEDPAPGSSEDAPPGLTESEQRQIIQEVAEKIEKQKGSEKGGALAKWASQVLNPRLDPKTLLRSAIRKAMDQIAGAGGEFSYRRASRRTYPGGTIRPREFLPVPRLTICVDTSGSMDQRDLGLALGVIQKVLDGLRLRDGVRVLQGDTEVQSIDQCRNAKTLGIKGRGGTSMTRVLEQACAEKVQPELVILVTDGETDWPDAPLGPKIVACLTREPRYCSKPPAWIKTVVIGSDE